MTNNLLTSDNLHLSETRMSALVSSDEVKFATSCNGGWHRHSADGALSDQAEDLLRHSISVNTERAYHSDLQHFRDWGGSLPGTPAMLCAYIGDQAGRLSVATIQRRIATLSKAHEAAGVINPCRAELVKATLRGLRRKHGIAQRQAAIRRGKTDQDGKGRRIGIPNGRTRHCPVGAIEAWLSSSRIEHGHLFRPINRHGHVDSRTLTGDAVSVVLRQRLATAGIDPTGYSGHSLRAGFATSAAQAGISTFKIRAQTGHASDAMLARYIREGELFAGNAAGGLL